MPATAESNRGSVADGRRGKKVGDQLAGIPRIRNAAREGVVLRFVVRLVFTVRTVDVQKRHATNRCRRRARAVSDASRPAGRRVGKRRSAAERRAEAKAIAAAAGVPVERRRSGRTPKPEKAVTAKLGGENAKERKTNGDSAPGGEEEEEEEKKSAVADSGGRRERLWRYPIDAWRELLLRPDTFVLTEPLSSATCCASLDVARHTTVAVDQKTHDLDAVYRLFIEDGLLAPLSSSGASGGGVAVSASVDPLAATAAVGGGTGGVGGDAPAVADGNGGGSGGGGGGGGGSRTAERRYTGTLSVLNE